MIDIRIGDCRNLIHGLADESVDCVMTSPPYWGLLDYKTEPIIFDGLQDCEHEWGEELLRNTGTLGNNLDTLVGTQTAGIAKHANHLGYFCSKCGAWRGQLGLEPTPELYIKHMLDFFDDVKLKLKAEGNCFVNIGDTYYGSPSNSKDSNLGNAAALAEVGRVKRPSHEVLKSKSLCMIPQRFAWGMIEHGWILRNEIIWYKPNHMPESVTDRLTKAHEVIYHFVKQQKYYYNLDAIREKPLKPDRLPEIPITTKFNRIKPTTSKGNLVNGSNPVNPLGKNPGDVWSITTQPYPESHFAVFPLELVRRPILAGCPIGGTVLDPFGGSGTVGEFCRHNDRNAILFELNPEYIKLIEERTMKKTPELSEYLN